MNVSAYNQLCEGPSYFSDPMGLSSRPYNRAYLKWIGNCRHTPTACRLFLVQTCGCLSPCHSNPKLCQLLPHVPLLDTAAIDAQRWYHIVVNASIILSLNMPLQSLDECCFSTRHYKLRREIRGCLKSKSVSASVKLPTFQQK